MIGTDLFLDGRCQCLLGGEQDRTEDAKFGVKADRKLTMRLRKALSVGETRASSGLGAS
jgi:hypothetical protein